MNSTNLVKKKSLVAAILLLLMFCFVNNAVAAQETDTWQYEATIYLWLPSIDGDLKYTLPGEGGGVSPDRFVHSPRFTGHDLYGRL